MSRGPIRELSLKRFSAILVGIALILCIAFVVIFESLVRNSVVESYRVRVEEQLSMRQAQLQDEINILRNKLTFIASTPPIAGILRSKQSGRDQQDGSSYTEWTKRLQTIFIAYLENNPEILQIRYIGVADGGRELVRVERKKLNILVAAEDQLQSKADSEYFRAAMKLVPDEVYYSDINLNREFGKIEFPYRPTFRILINALDDSGNIFGFVILNIDAQVLINSLTEKVPHNLAQFILNSTGGFIYNPLDNRKNFSFEFDPSAGWGKEFTVSNEIEQVGDFIEAVGDRNSDRYLFMSAIVPLEAELDRRNISLVVGVLSSQIDKEVSVRVFETMLLVTLVLAIMVLGFISYQSNILKRFKLLKDHAEFEAIVSSSSDAVIAMDERGVVHSWNPAAEQIFGFSAQSAMGKSIFNMLFKAGEASAFTTEKISYVFAGEYLANVESVATTRYGSDIDISANLSPIILADGEVVGVAAIIRDVSESKAIQAEIYKMNLELERKVAERTRELETARNEAIDASEMKSGFIANVSHEIRTPMNGVIGMLHMLAREGLTEKQHRLVRMAESSAQALTSLINDILDMSKIEADKLDLENREFSLINIVSDISTSLAIGAAAKDLEFVLSTVGVKHDRVVGDANRLRQILTNLISNAIKFTSEGEVYLHCETELIDDEIDSSVVEVTTPAKRILLRCYVRDTGVGIAEENVGKLFDAFTQEDSGVTRKFGGTGLGLTICRQLCKLMGGNIGVTSQKDRGSKFRFEIILECESEQLPFHIVPEVQQLSVLVVSPNTSIRQTLEAQLHSWGVSVVATLSELDELGSEALRNYSRIYRLVLVDEAACPHGECRSAEFKQYFASGNTTMVLRANTFEGVSSVGLKDLLKPVTPHMLWFTVLDVAGISSEEARREYLRGSSYRGPSVNRIGRRKSALAEKLKGSCVMLVDDNLINREVGSGLLEDLGIDVVLASSGREAIELLASGSSKIDLVLMDCQMPDLDGYATTKEIRKGGAGETAQNIPIVAMTANAMSGARERCLQSGMNDYMTKPIDPDELEVKLQPWLASGLAHLKKPNYSLTNDDGLAGDRVIAEHLERDKDVGAVPALIDAVEDDCIAEDSSSSIWDERAALTRLRGNRSRLLKLIAMFLQRMPERMEALEQARQARDKAALQKLAHEIRGVASNIDGVKLIASCEQLEYTVESADDTTLDSMVEAVNTSYIEFEQVLTAAST